MKAAFLRLGSPNTLEHERSATMTTAIEPLFIGRRVTVLSGDRRNETGLIVHEYEGDQSLPLAYIVRFSDGELTLQSSQLAALPIDLAEMPWHSICCAHVQGFITDTQMLRRCAMDIRKSRVQNESLRNMAYEANEWEKIRTECAKRIVVNLGKPQRIDDLGVVFAYVNGGLTVTYREDVINTAMAELQDLASWADDETAGRLIGIIADVRSGIKIESRAAHIRTEVTKT